MRVHTIKKIPDQSYDIHLILMELLVIIDNGFKPIIICKFRKYLFIIQTQVISNRTNETL